MKSSLWFETSMLALILIAAVISTASEESAAHRGLAGAQNTAQVQPQHLASGR